MSRSTHSEYDDPLPPSARVLFEQKMAQVRAKVSNYVFILNTVLLLLIAPWLLKHTNNYYVLAFVLFLSLALSSYYAFYGLRIKYMPLHYCTLRALLFSLMAVLLQIYSDSNSPVWLYLVITSAPIPLYTAEQGKVAAFISNTIFLLAYVTCATLAGGVQNKFLVERSCAFTVFLAGTSLFVDFFRRFYDVVAYVATKSCAVVEAIGDPVIALDGNLKIINANRSAVILFDYPDEESLLHRSLGDIVKSEDMVKINDYINLQLQHCAVCSKHLCPGAPFPPISPPKMGELVRAHSAPCGNNITSSGPRSRSAMSTQAQVIQALKERRSSLGPVSTLTMALDIVKRSGSIAKSYFSLSAIHSGPDIGFVSIIRDPCDFAEGDVLKDAASKVDESYAVKKQFIAVMSHEIQTPISTLSGFVKLMMEMNPDPIQHEMLRRMVKVTHYLKMIVEDILAFSKLESKTFTLHEKIFKLDDAIYNASDIVAKKIYKKGLEFILDVDVSCLITAKGDVCRLTQVLVNLLSNSAKFTDEGCITVKAQATYAKENNVALVTIDVIDTGLGIPENVRHLLFKPFSRIDNTIERQHEGTGLGLAVSRGLVELMQGDLVLLSSTPGHGSIFRVTLPVPMIRGLGDISKYKNAMVLIASSSALLQDAASRFLLSLGCRVQTLNSFTELSAFAVQPLYNDVDLILIDLHTLDLQMAHSTLLSIRSIDRMSVQNLMNEASISPNQERSDTQTYRRQSPVWITLLYDPSQVEFASSLGKTYICSVSQLPLKQRVIVHDLKASIRKRNMYTSNMTLRGEEHSSEEELSDEPQIYTPLRGSTDETSPSPRMHHGQWDWPISPGNGQTQQQAPPSLETRPPPDAVTNTQTEKPSSGAVRVLLAEDNSCQRYLLRCMASNLSKHTPIELDLVEDGQAAIDQILANKQYDIILLDLMMPVVDGNKAAAAIREILSQRQVTQLPFIVCITAADLTENLCDEKLFDLVVPKSLDTQKWQYIMNCAAERSRQQRQLSQAGEVPVPELQQNTSS